jgi:hypothetical protein
MKLKKTSEHFYFSLFSFLSLFSYFFPSPSFFSFFPSPYFFPSPSSLYFLFFIFMLLQAFKKHSTCYGSPPPCLNDCSSSSIEVTGPMAAREVRNPCVPLSIFWNLQGHPTWQNSHNQLHWWVPPYVICLEIMPENLQKIHWKIIHAQFGLWSRRKSQKDVLGLGWMPSEVWEISNVETHNG